MQGLYLSIGLNNRDSKYIVREEFTVEISNNKLGQLDKTNIHVLIVLNFGINLFMNLPLVGKKFNF